MPVASPVSSDAGRRATPTGGFGISEQAVFVYRVDHVYIESRALLTAWTSKSTVE